MLRFSTTREEFNKANGFWQDNPLTWNDRDRAMDWLCSNQRTPTAGFKRVMLDPKKLMTLPGEMGEERFYKPADDTWTEDDLYGRDWVHEQVDSITDSMQEIGWDKDNPSGNIFVIVEANGKAFISEGNKRTRAAARAGIEQVPVEVKFCGGSEMLPDGWHPMEAL